MLLLSVSAISWGSLRDAEILECLASASVQANLLTFVISVTRTRPTSFSEPCSSSTLQMSYLLLAHLSKWFQTCTSIWRRLKVFFWSFDQEIHYMFTPCVRPAISKSRHFFAVADYLLHTGKCFSVFLVEQHTWNRSWMWHYFGIFRFEKRVEVAKDCRICDFKWYAGSEEQFSKKFIKCSLSFGANVSSWRWITVLAAWLSRCGESWFIDFQPLH